MKKWHIPALIGIAVLVLVIGLAAIYQPDPIPVCKGDLELIDNTCQCKEGWEKIGVQCHLRDQPGAPGGTIPDACDEFPELCDVPKDPAFPEK